MTLGIEVRKAILNRCEMILPFVPEQVNGKRWQDAPTETIVSDSRYFSFAQEAKWHGFAGYA